MRRASVSIASNIAKGAARQSRKEFMHFLTIAAGSASELNTQLNSVLRIGMGEPSAIKAVEEVLDIVSRMLQGLVRSLRQKSSAVGCEDDR